MGPSITYVRNWEEGAGHAKDVQLRTTGGVFTPHMSLFMFLAACLSYGVLYGLPKFNLSSLK